VLLISSAWLKPLAPVLLLTAVLVIVAAGVSLIFQSRRLGLRLLLGGVALAVMGALLTQALSSGARVPLSLVGDIIAGLAIVAAILAGTFRAALAGIAFLLVCWMVAPLVPAAVSIIPLWLILVAVVPAIVFGGIWLLQHVLRAIYGDDAAAHVTGEYLVRVLDGLALFLGRVLAFPFRLLRHDNKHGRRGST
jgi:hypothetical protein